MRLKHGSVRAGWLGRLLALALAASGGLAAAQVETVQPPSPVADALAAQMRVLGADPKNVPALIEAGELALKLGDPTAAARFFGRAERLDPRNARLKAGEASALVHLERPGEALRLFQEALDLGADPVSFAAEQALALDLVGQQTRAQRAYRTALKAGRDDETERRYALSLGISGQREAALEQIDAQLRRSDRAAWRVRAFVLAMTGDLAGANRIAAATLPPTMASGLEPFFDRLGGLGPVDRAFAVHFGEVSPTPERIADARLAPVFSPLPAQRVAVAEPVRPLSASDRAQPADKRRRRDTPRSVEAVALAQPPAVALAATRLPRPAPRDDAAATSAKPAAAVPVAETAVVTASNAGRGAEAAALPAAVEGVAERRAPAVLGSPAPDAAVATGRPTATATVAAPVVAINRPAAPEPEAAAVSQGGASQAVALLRPAPAPVAAQPPQPAPDAATNGAVAARAALPEAEAAERGETPAEAGTGIAAASPGVAVSTSPEPTSSQPTVPTASATASATESTASPVAAAPISEAASPAAEPASQAAAASPESSPAVRRRPVAVASEDSLLARIIAGIGVPASELGIGPVRPPVVAGARGAADRAAPPAEPPVAPPADDDAASARRAALDKAAAVRAAEAKRRADTKSSDKAAAAKLAADKATADKTATDKKAADKKLADKAATDKKAADKKLADKQASDKQAADTKLGKANPSRVWVQVSGGANVRDLPKAWAALLTKAPALKGKSAWTTPLRFTNRLLTGPFGSQAEAQGFVNTLATSGVSGFVFTSDKGQAIARVAAP